MFVSLVFEMGLFVCSSAVCMTIMWSRQMQKWNTSAAKQREMSRMLDEWYFWSSLCITLKLYYSIWLFFSFLSRAVYIRRKYGHKQLSSSTYLSEAEPFLEQYAKRSPQNQALVGSAGSFVRAEDFMAIIAGSRDEEGDLEPERDIIPSSPAPMVKEAVRKNEGLIVFFPGKSYAGFLQPSCMLL